MIFLLEPGIFTDPKEGLAIAKAVTSINPTSFSAGTGKKKISVNQNCVTHHVSTFSGKLVFSPVQILANQSCVANPP